MKLLSLAEYPFALSVLIAAVLGSSVEETSEHKEEVSNKSDAETTTPSINPQVDTETGQIDTNESETIAQDVQGDKTKSKEPKIAPTEDEEDFDLAYIFFLSYENDYRNQVKKLEKIYDLSPDSTFEHLSDDSPSVDALVYLRFMNIVYCMINAQCTMFFDFPDFPVPLYSGKPTDVFNSPYFINLTKTIINNPTTADKKEEIERILLSLVTILVSLEKFTAKNESDAVDGKLSFWKNNTVYGNITYHDKIVYNSEPKTDENEQAQGSKKNIFNPRKISKVLDKAKKVLDMCHNFTGSGKDETEVSSETTNTRIEKTDDNDATETTINESENSKENTTEITE